MSADDTQPSLRSGRFIVAFISYFFLALGVATFLLLAIIWTHSTNIREVLETNPDIGNIIWATVRNLGVVFPLVGVGFGVATLRLSRKLRTRNRNAAAWARLLLLWLVIVFAILLIQSNNTHSLPGLTAEEFSPPINFTAMWGAMMVVTVFAFMILRGNSRLFVGREDVHDRDTRAAWNMLMPTSVILGVIAIYPLERIFISSLTNEQFASSTMEDFIGLDNYTKLLAIRLDSLPCATDETTGQCQTRINSDGETEIVRVSPLQHLGDSYRNGRYREVTSFEISGNYFLLSARDPVFIETLWDTMVFTVVTVILELILGLILAVILVNRFRGISLMRVIILIPWAVPTIVSTLFWDVMLRGDQSGLVNNILLSLGLIDRSQSWLTDSSLQLPMLILVDVWKTTPSMAIMLMPGLLVIPRDICQAAEVDGAGRFRRFFSITLPLLVPIIAIATIFRALNAIRVFDVFQLLVGRSRFSLATYTQEVLVQRQEVGYSSAIGVIIFFIIIIFVAVYLKALRVDSD
jgi:trehalose/maltose transport system permease protein